MDSLMQTSTHSERRVRRGRRVVGLSFVVLLWVAAMTEVHAETTPSPPSGSSTNAVEVVPAKSKQKLKTFHGKIMAWDPVTMIATVHGWRKHTMLITSATKITRNNEPVGLDAIGVGETLFGQYVKSEDGVFIAKSLHLKGKGETAPKWPEDPENPAEGTK